MNLEQKQGPIAIIKETLQARGITGLYSGCSALVVGNSLKAGVRFVSYDHFKNMLADAEVCVLVVARVSQAHRLSRAKLARHGVSLPVSVLE